MTPEDDLAAAEYALGTLSPPERAALAARRLREPDLDAAIRAWEDRLAPLAEALAPIEPSEDHLPAIQARIRAAPSASSETAPPMDAVIADLLRRAGRWRAAAIAASVVAALLAVGLTVRETERSARPREYVAILQKDAASPAFEVTVDLDRLEFSVRPIAATAPPGKSYELWLIDQRLGPPRSLGVIGEARRAASSRRLRPQRGRGCDLCGDRRAARRIARRQALRSARLCRQAHPGRAVEEPVSGELESMMSSDRLSPKALVGHLARPPGA